MKLCLPLLLVLFLGLPTVLCAQKQKGQWSDLKGLKVGQGIQVIESNMKSHGGEFVAIDDEAISLREKGSDVLVKRENVVRVSTTSGARRGEHAVIGLLVGAGIGAGAGAIAGSRAQGGWASLSEGVGALIGIAVGGVGGTIVGASIPAHTTIYSAAPAALIQKGKTIQENGGGVE